MTDFYIQHQRLYVAVDCIIFGLVEGRLCLLLAPRRFEPEMGKWSLMGGFVGADESIDDASRRVLRQLTGLENVYMQQVGAFGTIERDPGERVVSVAYYALLAPGEFDISRLTDYDARWMAVDELPPLGFDHPQMVGRALEMLREQMAVKPIAFRLLPARFTLTQLQQLYEMVGGRMLDKRNFRKRVAENHCISQTGEICKTTSRRGAALYSFDYDAYSASALDFRL